MQRVYTIVKVYVLKSQLVTTVDRVYGDYESALTYAISKNKEVKNKKIEKGYIYYDVQENLYIKK